MLMSYKERDGSLAPTKDSEITESNDLLVKRASRPPRPQIRDLYKLRHETDQTTMNQKMVSALYERPRMHHM